MVYTKIQAIENMGVIIVHIILLKNYKNINFVIPHYIKEKIGVT